MLDTQIPIYEYNTFWYWKRLSFCFCPRSEVAFANDKMSQFEDSLDKYILRKRTIVCLSSYTDNAHIG